MVKTIETQAKNSSLAKQAVKADSDTEHLIAQAKLEWESTADSLPQMVFLLDEKTNVIRANRTVERWGVGRVA
ncbi:MAG: hypothetical protein WCB36_05880, partial [Burkholderiales bacterium]